MLSWPLSTSKVLFLEMPFEDRHRINSLTGDQRLFAKSTIRLVVYFSLFSDGAKHGSFPVNFPKSYSREID